MYRFSQALLINSICRESFYDFVQQFWTTIIQETPVWNWHIPYLCAELQTVAERVFRAKPKEYDLVINIPPGTTKSTIVSVMYPAWLWTRMPSCRVIGGSHTHALALDLSRKGRDIVKSELYRAAFPAVQLRPDQDTKGYWANTRSGFRYAVGVGGSVIGMHGHVLIKDDPIDPASAISEADLASVNRWCSETLPSRKVDKEVAVDILIMQRLHQNDPTGYVLAKQKQNVRHICLPAEDGDNVSPPALRQCYRNGLLDPVRLSKPVLENMLVDIGQYAYSGQYSQSPVPPGGGMFKVNRIELVDAQAAPKQFVAVARYWDKAGTAGGGAYTVGAKLGMTYDQTTKLPRFWILDIVRGQWDSDVREARIVQTAKLDGKQCLIGVEQEPGSGGKESAEATARRLAGYRVRVDKVTGDKALRADPFSVQVNAGAVAMVSGPWAGELLQEMTYFPFSTYKDQVDALAGAFAIVSGRRARVGGGL